MSTNFDSELDSLLDKNDEKKKKHVEVQEKARDEAAEFLSAFEEVATSIIRPALKHVKSQLEARGRLSRIEEESDGVTYDRKEKPAKISIYFNISPEDSISSLDEYAHVCFYCDKRGKLVQVHESTIGPNHGGHSGSSGSLQLSEVSEETVKEKVMKVLREIFK